MSTMNEKTSFRVPKLTTLALYQIKLMAFLGAKNRADIALTDAKPSI